MTTRTPLLIAAAGLLASPSAAQRNNPTAAGAHNQIVCKYQTKTGTRFKDKTCRTRQQWEELRIQNQRDLKEMVDRVVIEDRREGRGE